MPIDAPNVTQVKVEVSEYNSVLLRTSVINTEKPIITNNIKASITKQNIDIPISLFFTIFHPLAKRNNHIINFWRL
jgi:hypothetical protein